MKIFFQVHNNIFEIEDFLCVWCYCFLLRFLDEPVEYVTEGWFFIDSFVQFEVRDLL